MIEGSAINTVINRTSKRFLAFFNLSQNLLIKLLRYTYIQEHKYILKSRRNSKVDRFNRAFAIMVEVKRENELIERKDSV